MGKREVYHVPFSQREKEGPAPKAWEDEEIGCKLLRFDPLTLPLLRNGPLPLPLGEVFLVPLLPWEKEGPAAQRWEDEGIGCRQLTSHPLTLPCFAGAPPSPYGRGDSSVSRVSSIR